MSIFTLSISIHGWIVFRSMAVSYSRIYDDVSRLRCQTSKHESSHVSTSLPYHLMYNNMLKAIYCTSLIAPL
jgi:outer membrane protease